MTATWNVRSLTGWCALFDIPERISISEGEEAERERLQVMFMDVFVTEISWFVEGRADAKVHSSSVGACAGAGAGGWVV